MNENVCRIVFNFVRKDSDERTIKNRIVSYICTSHHIQSLYIDKLDKIDTTAEHKYLYYAYVTHVDSINIPAGSLIYSCADPRVGIKGIGSSCLIFGIYSHPFLTYIGYKRMRDDMLLKWSKRAPAKISFRTLAST